MLAYPRLFLSFTRLHPALCIHASLQGFLVDNKVFIQWGIVVVWQFTVDSHSTGRRTMTSVLCVPCVSSAHASYISTYHVGSALNRRKTTEQVS